MIVWNMIPWSHGLLLKVGQNPEQVVLVTTFYENEKNKTKTKHGHSLEEPLRLCFTCKSPGLSVSDACDSVKTNSF